MKKRPSSGFSLMETLVAVAIVAIALVPILSLEADMARRFTAQRAQHAALQSQSHALAILRDLNFTETPSGERALGDGLRLTWTARPLSRPTRSTLFPRGEGNFEVVLWRVDVRITGRTLAQDVAFSIDKLGWRRLEVSPSERVEDQSFPN